MPLKIGDTFASYRVLRQLGSGGMGEVYLVQHPRLPREEALKVLRPEFSQNESFRERFIREADLASGLRHPHIIGIHDRGEHNDQLWIAMDYIDGTDLSQLLERRYPHGMPVGYVLPVVTAVASALDYAHKKGLLHRDVKPANIIVADLETGDPKIFLADFGIARPLDDTSSITTTNMTVGTVAYAAPEQLMGDSLDGRTDQYALAATTYHLLTGSQVFPNSNPAVVISRHLNAPAPDLGAGRQDLVDLEPVLRSGLAKLPDERYPSCSALANALVVAAHEQRSPSPIAPTLAAPGPVGSAAESTSPSPDTGPRPRWVILLSAASAILLMVVIAFTWRPWDGQRSNSASTSTLPTSVSTPISTPSSPLVSTQIGTPPSAPTTTATPAKVCVTGAESAPVQAVVSRFSPNDVFPGTSEDLSHLTVVTEGGNFDSCATLSAVFISIAEGTGSTPSLVLLFHKGSYVGPATPEPRSFTSLDPNTTDDTVVLKYGTPGSCNACPDMTFTVVQFKWQVDHVEMIGTPPESYAG
ncbi:protein kinase domain-containing protein [Mycolicibacterium holsaticum]|uniref:protein kinase domain-containing protein n=1 Tax=Mycolicibacterium holsaticum TaxID=152142 RepID=UPI00084867D1|nr:protein kinase [Mycolicibacterium holsaticum]